MHQISSDDKGKYPVHSNGSFSWLGYVDFDENPMMLNPPQNYIVSANNKVITAYDHVILNDNDWEVQENYYVAKRRQVHFRAERITQMILEKGTGITLDDIKIMHMDRKSLLFEYMKPILVLVCISTFDFV